MKTTVDLPDELYRRAKAEISALTKRTRGVRNSSVPDLASNPKHLSGFGRNARHH